MSKAGQKVLRGLRQATVQASAPRAAKRKKKATGTKRPKTPAKEAAPPETVAMLSTIVSLEGKPAAYEVTLTEAEYAGIGYVTVQWALLEAVIATLTQSFCERSGVPLPKDATNFSFARRVRALRDIATKVLKATEAKDVLLKQLQKIGQLAGMRQRITHHLWEYDPRNPENVWSKSIRDPALRLEPFNVQKLRELGMRIGQVIYALNHPLNQRPGTVEILKENLSDDNGKLMPFVSRELLLALGEEARNERDHPPKTRPARKSRHRSSKADRPEG